MNGDESSLWDQVVFTLSLFGVWVSGEAGRAAFAGAAGGLIRHLMSELRPRRIRDGFVSIVAGALMAQYFSPVALSILENWFGELRGDVDGAAAFAAGIMGMSLTKIILGLLDKQAGKFGGRDA